MRFLWPSRVAALHELPFRDIRAQPALGRVIVKTHAERLGQVQALPPGRSSRAKPKLARFTSTR